MIFAEVCRRYVEHLHPRTLKRCRGNPEPRPSVRAGINTEIPATDQLPEDPEDVSVTNCKVKRAINNRR
jgi:hypothetical protein